MSVAANRLRRIFNAKPSINAATTTVFRRGSYETPEGLRSVVDNFKDLCECKQFRRTANMYSATVRRLVKAQAFPMIEEILDHQKKYDDISSEGFVIRLITLYGKARMFDHALQLFDEMPSFNAPRSAKSLTALLNAAITAKRYDTVPELFRKLHSQHSIKPDTPVYNVVVNAYCKMGSTDSALSMLREMEELGLEPNLFTFNTLLHGFYQQHGFAEGEKIWSMMQARSNVSPNVVSYMLKMKAVIGDGGVTEGVKVVDEMRANGVEPDVRFFSLLIESFCGDGKVEEAKYWYHEMMRCGCVAGPATYGALVPFLCKKGDFDLAFKLCKDAIGGKSLLIDEGALKRVVEAFVAEGRVGEAEKLVGLARKKNLEINLITP